MKSFNYLKSLMNKKFKFNSGLLLMIIIIGKVILKKLTPSIKKIYSFPWATLSNKKDGAPKIQELLK